jgi:hypothetical protein
MAEKSLQRIMRKTGRKPVSCKCRLCKEQCRTPCLGTPEDILSLIEAGHGDKLYLTEWCVGIFVGKLYYSIRMVQALQTADGCVFRMEDGLCLLHDSGLKPTEGKLSHHSITKENFKFSRGLAYNVAQEWMDEKNRPLVNQILGLYGSKFEAVSISDQT